jgi:hypothetical protein
MNFSRVAELRSSQNRFFIGVYAYIGRILYKSCYNPFFAGNLFPKNSILEDFFSIFSFHQRLRVFLGSATEAACFVVK